MGGLAMLLYGVWSEYSWASRTKAALPDHIVVAKTYSSQSIFSPWTYLFPREDRMTLIDLSKHKRNEKYPDIILTELLLIKRFEQTARVAQLFNCKEYSRADLKSPSQLSDENFMQQVKWQTLNKDDNLLRKVCNKAS